jgi:hypothetical protein
MREAPLQLLIGSVATVFFWRRGDRPWLAVVKGVLASLIATIMLSLILWITS